MPSHRVMLPLLLTMATLASVAAENRAAPLPHKAADLYKGAHVWTLHFTFTPEQWQALQPKESNSGPFGGPGGPGRGGFGPAMLLAPAFVQQGDQDRDGKLSPEEFRGLGEKWFAEWDKESTGKLDGEKLRTGLNATLTSADPGRRGGGGRGPGLNLQGPEGKRNGLAAAAGVEFPYVRADLEFEGQTLKDVAVRYKGNGTWMQSRGSMKRSLKVDLNRFVKTQKLAGVATLNLHNGVTDASWMNEVLSHRLFRDAGVPAPRTAYARVYVTVPGEHNRKYLGLYSLVEAPDKAFAEERSGVAKGAIFKPVTPAPFTDLGDEWAQYNQTYDPKTELTPRQKQRVIDFCKLVSHADEAEFAAKLGDYLDLDEFARFMAVTVWVCTLDSILGPGQNYYVYLHPRTGKLQFIPWDLDHSFGQFGMMANQEQRENLSIHKPWRGENRFLERVFKVEAFKQLYLAKLEEFSKTIFTPRRFHQQVDEIAAAIRPAVQEESEEKLARFARVVAGEPVSPAGFGGGFGGPRRAGSEGEGPGFRSGQAGGGPRPGAPGGGPGGPGFFQPSKPIKGFVEPRAQSVLAQVQGKSKGETLGDGFGGGRGGRGGFGPGNFLGNGFMTALDANKDGELTRIEFREGFGKWFAAWNTDKSGTLTDEQLRAGINQDLSPFRGGPGGFGPPGGPSPRP